MARTSKREASAPDPVPLVTPLEKICYLIVKAREFDAKVDVIEPDPGSNPSDDDARGVLEDYPDDPTYQELAGALDLLNDDERIEVLALTWVGRGDFDVGEWGGALEQARTVHNRRETGYLTETPLLGDYLEEGLSLLGYSCEDFDKEHL